MTVSTARRTAVSSEARRQPSAEQDTPPTCILRPASGRRKRPAIGARCRDRIELMTPGVRIGRATGVQRLPAWFAVAALTLTLAGCSSQGAERAGAGKNGRSGNAGGDTSAARAVQVAPSVEDRLVRAVSVTGTLAAEEQVTLSLKVTGRLSELFVDLGSRVTRGQVVARLAPTDFTLRVQQAQAARRQARARLGLTPDGSDTAVDPEKTGVVRQAKAVLDEAKLTRDRAETFVSQGIGDARRPRRGRGRAAGRGQPSSGRVRGSAQPPGGPRAAHLRARARRAGAARHLPRLAARRRGARAPRHRRAVPRRRVAGRRRSCACIRCACAWRCRSARRRRFGSARWSRVTVEGDEQRVRGTGRAREPGHRRGDAHADGRGRSAQSARALLRPGSFANAEIVMAGRRVPPCSCRPPRS